MYTQQISVYELEKYWKEWETSENEVFHILPISCMPPWHDICSELNWKIRLVEPGYFSGKHYGYCGVYRLIGLASENDVSKPAALSRVCAQDTTGTLYIGEAGNLSGRLNQLRRSLRSHRGERSHHAASILRDTPLLDFPTIKLAVGMLFTGKSTGLVESHLMKAYINSFGDTPPLNYRI